MNLEHPTFELYYTSLQNYKHLIYCALFKLIASPTTNIVFFSIRSFYYPAALFFAPPTKSQLIRGNTLQPSFYGKCLLLRTSSAAQSSTSINATWVCSFPWGQQHSIPKAAVGLGAEEWLPTLLMNSMTSHKGSSPTSTYWFIIWKTEVGEFPFHLYKRIKEVILTKPQHIASLWIASGIIQGRDSTLKYYTQ